MKKSWKFLWIKIIVLLIGVGLLLYFFFENLEFEILGSAIGLMLTAVGTDFLTSLLLLREEKIKLESHKFTYDEVFYRKNLKIGGGETCIWYDAAEYEGDTVYEVKDEPTKQFQLDPVLQNNFGSIMQAHRASFIANPIMIRLDDYQRENGKVYLYTSRTAFYNDLVTNRAMDYKFNDEMSVREIFESGRYLSPLKESRMSNPIGFGAFIFYGNSMIVAHRGGNATVSKNKFTSALAFGFSEDDLRRVHDPLTASTPQAAERYPELTTDDLFRGILLVRMADALNMELPRVRELYAQDKIRIHTLGFGQLVYTGGKPQFYFAIIIDESVNLRPQKDKEQIRAEKKAIDFNKNMVFADNITLVKNGDYVLRLHKQGTNKTIKGEAEKSFFINYWHLLSRPRIEGVPDWIYEC